MTMKTKYVIATFAALALVAAGSLFAVGASAEDNMKPETTKPESMKPDHMKGDAMKGDAMKGDAMKGDAMKGDAMKGDAMKGDAMKPDHMKGDAMKGDDAMGGARFYFLCAAAPLRSSRRSGFEDAKWATGTGNRR